MLQRHFRNTHGRVRNPEDMRMPKRSRLDISRRAITALAASIGLFAILAMAAPDLAGLSRALWESK